MLGMMKRKHQSENIDYAKNFTKPLNHIAEILPSNYDKRIILYLFVNFYPYIKKVTIWNSVKK